MKASKTTKLRKWLESGQSVTGLQALKNWNLYRLSDAIFKLKNRGLNIVCENVTKNGETYGKYYIPK